MIKDTHTVKTCFIISAKASKAEKKLCGFAFMRLTDEEDIVIKDALHNLCIYKVHWIHHNMSYIHVPCVSLRILLPSE